MIITFDLENTQDIRQALRLISEKLGSSIRHTQLTYETVAAAPTLEPTTAVEPDISTLDGHRYPELWGSISVKTRNLLLKMLQIQSATLWPDSSHTRPTDMWPMALMATKLGLLSHELRFRLMPLGKVTKRLECPVYIISYGAQPNTTKLYRFHPQFESFLRGREANKLRTRKRTNTETATGEYQHTLALAD